MKGRIIKGIGGLYTVEAEDMLYECNARGRFRRAGVTPTVGDYVEFSLGNNAQSKGSIDKILDRKNFLIRPRVANVDCAVIQFAAAHPDINYDLLDRFLILAEAQGVEQVIICINKCDLISEGTHDYLDRVYAPVYPLIYASAIRGEGIEKLRELLNGCVTVFAGPSGVGKSSVINELMPYVERQTGEISHKIKRGKHTTREVELIKYDDDTFIVDSPGFTSLGLDLIQKDELVRYFREFRPYLQGCYYSDCSHISEPDCVLNEHVGKEISPERYNRYIQLYNELKQRR